MTTRFELRPHVWSKDWPHDGGYCIYDTITREVVGWAKDQFRHDRKMFAVVLGRGYTDACSVR